MKNALKHVNRQLPIDQSVNRFTNELVKLLDRGMENIGQYQTYLINSAKDWWFSLPASWVVNTESNAALVESPFMLTENYNCIEQK